MYKHPNITYQLFLRQIWKPDPHFARQYSHHSVESAAFDLIDETFLAWKTEEEQIKLKFATRIEVEVICDMDFADFPFDSHDCQFILQSLTNQKKLR